MVLWVLTALSLGTTSLAQVARESILLPSGKIIEGSFYRLNDEVKVKKDRFECGTKCNVDPGCHYFAIDDLGSCKTFSYTPGMEDYAYLVYYKPPMFTMEVKTQAYQSRALGFFRINEGNSLEMASRGINLIHISTQLFTIARYKYFDTYTSGAAAKLVKELENAPKGTIILGGTKSDASKNLYPALKALESHGVKLADLEFRGHAIFAMVKGYPDKTFFLVQPVNVKNDTYVKLRFYSQNNSEDPASYVIVNSGESKHFDGL